MYARKQTVAAESAPATGERSKITVSEPTRAGNGTSYYWSRTIRGMRYSFTKVIMPNGERRYFVSRYNGYGDTGTEDSRATGMRFACAWSLVHSIIIAPAESAPSAAAPARTVAPASYAVAPASAISPRTLRAVAPALALLDYASMIARKHGRNWAKRVPGHSPTLGKRLAAWYELQLMRPRAVTPEIVALWSRLGAEVDAQWEALTACIDVTISATDPYACAAELFADLDRGRMRVFATASTGGHPVWTNGQNDRFRAVHDVFGHYLNRVTFDRNGEDAAYRSHRSMFSAGVLPALACELRAQTSVLCYGSQPGTFRDQIAVPVPAEYVGDDMQVNRWVFPID